MANTVKRPADLTLDALVTRRVADCGATDPISCIRHAMHMAEETSYVLEHVAGLLQRVLSELDDSDHWKLCNELRFWSFIIGENHLQELHGDAFYNGVAEWFAPAFEDREG